MPRAPIQYVDSPGAWSLLIAPVRAEIVEAIRLQGPCSVADIAATLDRPADALYKHLEILEKAGLVVEAGFRKTGRNAERLVDVVADDFAVHFHDPAGKEEMEAVVATANSFVKAAARAVRDSASAGQIDLQEPNRNVTINYELGWLSAERFQEVRGLLRRLKEIMDESKRTREGRLYMTLAIATPVTRKRHARQTSSETPAARPAAKRAARATSRAKTPTKSQSKSPTGRRSR